MGKWQGKHEEKRKMDLCVCAMGFALAVHYNRPLSLSPTLSVSLYPSVYLFISPSRARSLSIYPPSHRPIPVSSHTFQAALLELSKL